MLCFSSFFYFFVVEGFGSDPYVQIDILSVGVRVLNCSPYKGLSSPIMPGFSTSYGWCDGGRADIVRLGIDIVKLALHGLLLC